jgi:hypothetical protein
MPASQSGVFLFTPKIPSQKVFHLTPEPCMIDPYSQNVNLVTPPVSCLQLPAKGTRMFYAARLYFATDNFGLRPGVPIGQ